MLHDPNSQSFWSRSLNFFGAVLFLSSRSVPSHHSQHHFSYDFAPLKFHKLAKQVRCAFSHAPSSGNWSCFCATTYHRMISTCAAAGRQGMKFLCFFKSRKSGFMCTRWNAHLCFGVRNERLLCAPIRLCCLFFCLRQDSRLKFCYFRVRAHIRG